jgi:hypothetical protein
MSCVICSILSNNIFPIKSSFARQKGAWTVVLHKHLLMYIMNMHYYYNIIVKDMDVNTVFSLFTYSKAR